MARAEDAKLRCVIVRGQTAGIKPAARCWELRDMSNVPRLQRHFRLFDAVALAVGSSIGSGIFLAQSYMAEWIQTPGILIGVWLFGGLFTIIAAMAYAEMAGMMPTAGGQCDFLREAFSDFWGFLFGWALFLVIRTGSNAAVALAFAKYLGALVPNIGEANVWARIPLGVLLPETLQVLVPLYLHQLEINSAQLMACGVIALLTAVNIRGVREGVFVQNLFTVLKVAALAALIVAGLASSEGNVSHFFPLTEPVLGEKALQVGFFAALAWTLSKALFTYEGWFNVTFVGEETHDAQRTLPRALLLSGIGITAVYMLTNITYLAVLPVGEIASVPENRVAERVAVILFGNIGSTLVIAAILVSTFGCLNGLILSGARACYAMARQGLFFRRCADLHPRANTPAVALIYQAVWSILLVFSGSFDRLTNYVTFVSVLFGGLTVVGLYRLRWTQPERPRPYRCWGYPITPALYLVICTAFLVYVFQGDPEASLTGILLVFSGVPFYFRWKARYRACG
jgi:APA family basic amino acid/polyamine antiporter